MSDWEPKIVAFLCNWCSYGAADLAGISKIDYFVEIMTKVTDYRVYLRYGDFHRDYL